MRDLVLIVFLTGFWGFASPWRVFQRGRFVGGNLGVPSGGFEESNLIVKTEWFLQRLDHFNPTDTRTWKQRFYTNDEFYDPNTGGPVFLMIGGEGEASKKWMTQGAWIDYAKQFGAMCFQVEHRYYGKSYPTKDLSTKNLQYLTSHQALADLASFITEMNLKYSFPETTSWIAFGGSYPGSLAAWLRLKYPHLVHGAMSASGPLIAQVDFYGIVQYNKDNRVGPKGVNNVTIDSLCELMTGKGYEPLDALAAVNNLLLTTYDQRCLDYKYDTMIQELRNSNWSSPTAEGGRQWFYQTCTEFGFFQSSSYKPQVFGKDFPVEFFIKQCMDVFGPKYNGNFIYKAADQTNAMYGGLEIDVTNVVFVHGSIDPWHALGITKTLNQGAPAIYINGTAHCANMYPKADGDLPQLKAARVEIAQLIDKWIRI